MHDTCQCLQSRECRSDPMDDECAIRPRAIGRNGLTSQVYEALQEQILDQTIAPGARINIDQIGDRARRQLQPDPRSPGPASLRAAGRVRALHRLFRGADPRSTPGSTTWCISASCWRVAPHYRAPRGATRIAVAARAGICGDGPLRSRPSLSQISAASTPPTPIPSGDRRQRGQLRSSFRSTTTCSRMCITRGSTSTAA